MQHYPALGFYSVTQYSIYFGRNYQDYFTMDDFGNLVMCNNQYYGFELLDKAYHTAEHH